MALLAWVARVAGRAVENKGLRAPEMRNLRTAPAPMEDVGSAQMDQPIEVDPRCGDRIMQREGRPPVLGQRIPMTRRHACSSSIASTSAMVTVPCSFGDGSNMAERFSFDVMNRSISMLSVRDEFVAVATLIAASHAAQNSSMPAIVLGGAPSGRPVRRLPWLWARGVRSAESGSAPPQARHGCQDPLIRG